MFVLPNRTDGGVIPTRIRDGFSGQQYLILGSQEGNLIFYRPQSVLKGLSGHISMLAFECLVPQRQIKDELLIGGLATRKIL